VHGVEGVADIAVADPKTFDAIVELAKKYLT